MWHMALAGIVATHSMCGKSEVGLGGTRTGFRSRFNMKIANTSFFGNFSIMFQFFGGKKKL